MKPQISNLKPQISKILLIYTGGTIGMNHNPQTGALEPFDFEHLLSRVPELAQFQTEIATYQFNPPIDSSDMSPKLWTELAHIIADHYEEYDGFVILHGTDTMAYTASALSFMLENLTKPVILTGSQLPIGQLRTDGKENLITSIEIAAARRQDGTAMVPEVGIYFNGHLMRGNRTTKQSADEFDAFESFNYPHLADAGVEITYHDEYIHRPSAIRLQNPSLTPQFRLDNNVIIFSLFPGIREDLIRHIIATPNLRAITPGCSAPCVKALAEARSSSISVSACKAVWRWDATTLATNFRKPASSAATTAP